MMLVFAADVSYALQILGLDFHFWLLSPLVMSISVSDFLPLGYTRMVTLSGQ